MGVSIKPTKKQFQRPMLLTDWRRKGSREEQKFWHVYQPRAQASAFKANPLACARGWHSFSELHELRIALRRFAFLHVAVVQQNAEAQLQVVALRQLDEI